MNVESWDTILVAGVNTRAIVKSAKDLGFRTVAVDCFDDVYLTNHADVLYSPGIEKSGSRNGTSGDEELFNLTLKALDLHDVDAIILSSGMEHDTEKVRKLGNKCKIMGNDADKLEFCEDKERLFHLADRLEIPHPNTGQARNEDEAFGIAEDIGYPLVLKPPHSGGGIGIKLVESPKELENSFERVLSEGNGDLLYIQEYIRGADASASILCNGEETRCLTVNEQIIGDARLGVPREFGYCGNIVPFLAEGEITSQIEEYSKTICSEIGLVGSNGVDLVVSNKPYLMEINPRFQNTIDLVEGSLGINLVEAHLRSFKGEITGVGDPKNCGAKLIIYAKRDIKAPNLTKLSDVVDIPIEGSFIGVGEPICSVLKFGDERDRVIEGAYKLSQKIQNNCYNPSRSSASIEPL